MESVHMKRTKEAFSLVEVNLSIFVVGAGLLVIFTLFPLGLRESEMSMEDTQEALFAEYVLGTLEGNALQLTEPYIWQGNPNGVFRTAILEDDVAYSIIPSLVFWDYNTNTIDLIAPVKFPPNNQDELYMKYCLIVTNYPRSTSWERKKVFLTVKSGRYGTVLDGRTYTTELMFTGM